MRIEAQAIKLTLTVRGSPSVKGQLLEFVRSITRTPKPRKPKQIAAYGDSFVRNYSRSY